MLAPGEASDRSPGQAWAQVMARLQARYPCARLGGDLGALARRTGRASVGPGPSISCPRPARGPTVCLGPASSQGGCRGRLLWRRGLSLETGASGDRRQSTQARFLEMVHNRSQGPPCPFSAGTWGKWLAAWQPDLDLRMAEIKWHKAAESQGDHHKAVSALTGVLRTASVTLPGGGDI